MFVRILKDAHDAGIVDLRRRGDDFEVGRAVEAAPVAEQVATHEKAAIAATTPSTPAPSGPRVGMGHRGAGARGRGAAPPPGLLSIGVVEEVPAVAAKPAPTAKPSDNGEAPTAGKPSRGRGRAKTAKKTAAEPPVAAPTPAAKAKRGAKKTASRPRAKKAAAGPKDQ
jgi:hypothetical protein